MDEQRTRGMILRSHPDLVDALQGDKGNLSHSLRTLEARGLLVIVRTHGGKAEALSLTAAGQKWARQGAGSCDEGNGAGAGGLGGLDRLPTGRRLPAPQGPCSQARRSRKKEVAGQRVHRTRSNKSNVRINACEQWRQYECYIQKPQNARKLIRV
jgi:hypothetical protein